MIRINLIAVGRLKEKYWRDACAEYEKRLSSFCKLNIIEVDETRCPENPSKAEIDAVINSEGNKIMSRIPKGSLIVAMCIEGKSLSSYELAQFIEKSAADGCGNITFVIGGSFGLSDSIKQAANLRLSMSEMTFPHMLARVMLLEQIYRCFQINNGGSYHK
jgi:23S rRNA (pseudouridine1915-N3)-methyltransferase